MTKTQALQHFGSYGRLAKAIGRAKSTIHNYREKLPRGVQYEIFVKTEGQLEIDKDYL